MASVLSAPHFHNEEAAYAFVEARLWPEGPVCPHCGGVERISKMQGKSTRIGTYKCYQCRKPFTVKIGTIFEDSHLKLHMWLQAIHLLCASKKGMSARQLQRMLGVGMKTAWFLGHRIREAMKQQHGLFTPPIGGAGKVVEADETFIGRKSTTKAFKPISEKMAVLSLVERGGSVRSFHVANVKANTLHTIIARHIDRQTHFMTDEAVQYNQIGWNFPIHTVVAHTANEYVRGNTHTNTAEGYFSILKRGIYGVYQHVSEAHLKRYLAEFDFRYSNRAALGCDDLTRTDRAVIGAKGKRLTYETTGGRGASHKGATA